MRPLGKPKFRAVAVMACDDEIIPLQERIETVGDDADLKEVYERSGTCSTSHAPAHEISCSSPAWNLFPEFLDDMADRKPLSVAGL